MVHTAVYRRAAKYARKLVEQGWDRDTAAIYARKRFGVGCFAT